MSHHFLTPEARVFLGPDEPAFPLTHSVREREGS